LINFTPDQLTDEWFQQQVDLMKCPEVVKRKVETKWAQVQELQARQNKKAQELAANYDVDQQQRANQNWQATIMAEAKTQLDEEKEFTALKDIRDRANKGDASAMAQFNALEQNVFPSVYGPVADRAPLTAPTATRKIRSALASFFNGGNH
jgi:hypothetical protein